MAELSIILDQHGRRAFVAGSEVKRRRRMRARYDTAQTTEDNRRHWAAADGLSADAANSKMVRDILRRRSRYECLESNSYASGMMDTLANMTIGTGPRLRVEPNTDDPRLVADGRQVEKLFNEWAKAVRLAPKLRVMRKAMAVDGESFAILKTNPGLRTDVKLDLDVIEADRVTTPDLSGLEENYIDGIKFDRWGNPIRYDVLQSHPGNSGLGLDPPSQDYDRIPADFMLHLFRQDRPGQHRGIPELTTSLHLFAQLRRFTLATLSAAETAADLAAVLETEAPPNEDEDPISVEPMDAIEFERNMLLALPYGTKMSQVRSEHPNTIYSDFKREVLNESARPVGMPYGIAAANSSGYNFSSAKMDHGLFYQTVDVVRHLFEIDGLDRVLTAWFDEAALIEGLLPGPEIFSLMTVWWAWPAREEIDPAKERGAQAIALKNGMTTRAAEYAKKGLDVDEQDQRAARDYGVDLKTYRQGIFKVHTGIDVAAMERAEKAEKAAAEKAKDGQQNRQPATDGRSAADNKTDDQGATDGDASEESGTPEKAATKTAA